MSKFLFIGILSSLLLSGCLGAKHESASAHWLPPDYHDKYPGLYYEEQEKKREESGKREERQDGWQNSETCGGGHSCKQ